MTEKAKQAQSLFFFAEGTFTRVPGLRDTRSILRSGSWFPRHGHISVNIGKAIAGKPANATGGNEVWQRAIVLRDAARILIAQHCGEPNLTSK